MDQVEAVGKNTLQPYDNPYADYLHFLRCSGSGLD